MHEFWSGWSRCVAGGGALPNRRVLKPTRSWLDRFGGLLEKAEHPAGHRGSGDFDSPKMRSDVKMPCLSGVSM